MAVTLKDLLFTSMLFTANANANWFFTGETLIFYNRWVNTLTLDTGVRWAYSGLLLLGEDSMGSIHGLRRANNLVPHSCAPLVIFFIRPRRYFHTKYLLLWKFRAHSQLFSNDISWCGVHEYKILLAHVRWSTKQTGTVKKNKLCS